MPRKLDNNQRWKNHIARQKRKNDRLTLKRKMQRQRKKALDKLEETRIATGVQELEELAQRLAEQREEREEKERQAEIERQMAIKFEQVKKEMQELQSKLEREEQTGIMEIEFE